MRILDKQVRYCSFSCYKKRLIIRSKGKTMKLHNLIDYKSKIAVGGISTLCVCAITWLLSKTHTHSGGFLSQFSVGHAIVLFLLVISIIKLIDSVEV